MDLEHVVYCLVRDRVSLLRYACGDVPRGEDRKESVVLVGRIQG